MPCLLLRAIMYFSDYSTLVYTRPHVLVVGKSREPNSLCIGIDDEMGDGTIYYVCFLDACVSLVDPQRYSTQPLLRVRISSIRIWIGKSVHLPLSEHRENLGMMIEHNGFLEFRLYICFPV